MWNSQLPGFNLPDSLADKTPPSPAAETAAGLGLAVFLTGMVGLMLMFHFLHVLNGYTMAVAIVVPGAGAGLVVRAIARPPDSLSALPAEDRPTYPRSWRGWNFWLDR